jgi:hypothetical protein
VRVVGSVEIDRPASQVWAYVADYGNDPSWRAAVTQMRPSLPGPAQVGVTTHERLRLWGMTFRTDATIDRVEAGHLLAWAPTTGKKQLQGSRLVEPTGPASSRFTEVVEGAWSGSRGRSGRWSPGCFSGRPPPTSDASRICWRRDPSAGPHRRNRRRELVLVVRADDPSIRRCCSETAQADAVAVS